MNKSVTETGSSHEFWVSESADKNDLILNYDHLFYIVTLSLSSGLGKNKLM